MPRRFTALLLVLSTAPAACSDDDSTAPTRNAVVGSYVATSMTANLAAIPINLLSGGGSLRATFADDGTVTGRLTLRDVPNNRGDVDEGLEGTWRIDGRAVDVQFRSQSGSFTEDMDFRMVGNTLVGEETVDGVRVEVVLRKQ